MADRAPWSSKEGPFFSSFLHFFFFFFFQRSQRSQHLLGVLENADWLGDRGEGEMFDTLNFFLWYVRRGHVVEQRSLLWLSFCKEAPPGVRVSREEDLVSRSESSGTEIRSLKSLFL